MKRLLCFFLGHDFPRQRADRTDPTLSLTLLMDPRCLRTCVRCGHQEIGRWRIVYENGLDYLETGPD